MLLSMFEIPNYVSSFFNENYLALLNLFVINLCFFNYGSSKQGFQLVIIPFLDSTVLVRYETGQPSHSVRYETGQQSHSVRYEVDHLKPLQLLSNMQFSPLTMRRPVVRKLNGFLQGHKASKDAKMIFEFRFLRSKLNHSSVGRGIHQI